MGEVNEVILTREGLGKLEKELDYLKSTKRREVAERIKQAVAFGDISENSEYEEAKNEQAFVEGRILTLEKKLRHARLMDDSEVSTEAVSLGVKVTLRSIDDNEEMEFTLVSSVEADPAKKKISNESPVGRAIMGHKAGSVVTVQVPVGELKYEVLSISK